MYLLKRYLNTGWPKISNIIRSDSSWRLWLFFRLNCVQKLSQNCIL